MKLTLSKAVVGLILATGAVAGTATTYSEISRANPSVNLTVSDSYGTPYLEWTFSGGTQESYTIYRKRPSESYFSTIEGGFDSYTNSYYDYSLGVADNVAPNKPVIISQTISGSEIIFGLTEPKDNGTEVKYKVAISASGNPPTYTESSEASYYYSSGFDGYSYILSNSSTGTPDNTVDSYSWETDSLSMSYNGEKYLHVKAIDMDGNASAVTTYQIKTGTDTTSPTLNLTLDKTGWTNSSSVRLQIQASDSNISYVKIKDGYSESPTFITSSGSTTALSGTYYYNKTTTVTVEAGDYYGNTTTKTASIQIDSVKPTLNVTKTDGYGNVAFTAKLTDTLSKPSQIQLYKKNSSGAWELVTFGSASSTTSSTYTYTFNVGEIGTYRIRGIDKAGNEVYSSEYVISSIPYVDNVLPTISVTGNPTSWTNKDVTLTVTGKDTLSGVKSITLPNGQVVSGSSTTYTVTANGSYTFKVTDVAGNVKTQTVSVTKIDKTNPAGSFTGNPTSWVKSDATITVTGSDSGSGVKSITKPDGTVVTGSSTTYTVSTNGTYKFLITDNAGNVLTHNVSVTKIDKTNPALSITGNPTAWTNKTATLTATASDTGSGIKQITKPDGTVVTGTSTTFDVTANKIVTFKVIDNAGNEISQNVTVSKVDKLLPTATVTGNPTAWTNGNATLTITGADTLSGVKSVTLPDGTVVSGKTGSYTATANGTYTFKVTDNAGNVTTKNETVSKIDKTNPTISVTGNPTSWTNGNATLTITASDSGSGVKSITKPDGTVVTGSSTTYTVSANGTYTFKVTDNVGNVLTHNVSVTKIDKTNPTATVTGNPTAWTKNNATLTITGADSGSGVKSITKPDGTVVTGSSTTYTVSANGTYTFKVTDNAGNVLTHNVSVTKIDKTNPTISVTGNPTSWTKNNVTLTVTGADSGSGVKQITKPDGTVVTGSSTTYTVSANGNYTFKVLDNAGNEVSQTVNVTKIDKTNPTVTVSGNPTSWTKNNATLTITGADSQSGVKQITKPDGTVVTGTSTTYAVSANGNYVFKVLDNAGNEVSQTVSVTKIDKTNPTVTVTGNPTSWTNGNATLTITGADSQSGVKQITKPDGTVVTGSSTTYTVTANGNYVFKVLDNAGNEVSQTVNVTKIDKTNPTVTVSGNPTSWTKNNATLTITGADSGSGVKQITKPDGTVVTGTSTTYTVSANGTYTFKVTDNVGNVLTHNVSVTKIDKTNPTISITGNPTSWTKNDVTLTITGADSGSGIKQITLPNNQVVSGSSTTYTVSANGNYTFKVTDNVGNEVSQTVNVTKIDKTAPTHTSTEIKNITTDGYDIYVYGVSDSQSGIKAVRFPTWTELNGQDDLAKNWNSDSNTSVKGEDLGNGTYKFRVNRSEHNNEFGNYITHVYLYDNVGNSTHVASLTHNLKDITNPTIQITGNPTSWVKSATLTITGADYGTGVKSITKPDGTVVTGSSTTYTVTANGDYTFKVTDNAGNVVSQTVNVTKIDGTNPTATVTGNPTSWTKNNATLTITGADTQSGVKSITKPDGTVVTGTSTTYTVSANGTYTFKVTDNVGNVLTHNVSVTKIDKTNPTISVTGNPTSWTKNDVTLTITGADSASGVKQITLPNGQVVSGSSTTYTVTANGNYTFKVIDNAGNEVSQTVNVTKIDKTNPTVNITGNPTAWTNGNATLTITTSDTQSGVKQIELPNGTIVTGTSTTYTVSVNNSYVFKVTDNAGNVTSQTVNVTKIDKTAPAITHTVNKNSESSATLSVTYTDNQSGIQSLVRPNGTTRPISTTTNTVTETETITQNSLILVSAVDNVGNKSSKSIDLLTLFADTTSSGVSRIEYKLTGATVKDWTTYTAPFYVTNEGVTTVTARVYDNAGNVSSEKTSTVRIDKTKPTNNSILIEIK